MSGVLAFELLVGGELGRVAYDGTAWRRGALLLLTAGGQCWACGGFEFEIPWTEQSWLRCCECESMFKGRHG